jgi:hypothetical protein
MLRGPEPGPGENPPGGAAPTVWSAYLAGLVVLGTHGVENTVCRALAAPVIDVASVFAMTLRRVAVGDSASNSTIMSLSTGNTPLRFLNTRVVGRSS